MRLQSEEQLLDPAIRAKIIEEIEGTENKNRKNEHYKRYQCYKDQTFLYVIKQLLKQFDQSTVIEMSYAIADLGFVRKVIDKLARVYKYGCTREVTDSEIDTESVQELADLMNFNSAMKKINRFYKLDKNTAAYICPKLETLEEDAKKIIKILPLQPFLYDVVELYEDREKPGCFILSDYEAEDFTSYYSLNPATANRTQTSVVNYQVGDGRDQTIADTPEDQRNYGTKDNKQYIFWSNKYHFTCNRKGMITSQGDMDNPIGEMPFVNFAEDQDGAFWAKGGDDLADGSILVNSMISNIQHIAITQGYGQLVMTGKNLPKNMKVGPNKVVQLAYEKDEDPEPTFEFKTANPPLDQLRALVESYVALLLTTNNLTTSGVSASLTGGTQFPSGIAMLIDKAESMEDVEDQRQIFIDNEPLIWKKIAKWQNVLKSSGELADSFREYVLPEDIEVNVKFNPAVVIQTEKEKLEVLQMKKALGIFSKMDILRTEYPDLTDEELKDKLDELTQEKLDAISQSFGDQGNGQGNLNNAGPQPPGGAQQNPGPANQTGRGGIPNRANPKFGGGPEVPA